MKPQNSKAIPQAQTTGKANESRRIPKEFCKRVLGRNAAEN